LLEEFVGRVSVVTGAASGIGFGIAEKCAREGMKVVLADIETNALENAECAHARDN
jgi:NAD(P)-dependent dehydrogenase (short-subunit alcohol dehydrogenase family)